MSCTIKDENVALSPSTKYSLTVTSHPTKPGCWDYTKGTVRTRSGRVLFIIDRNYSAFPYSWIEGHKNGHDYLICGYDYQGQTVLELDTGKRVDYRPKNADIGHGFCWAAHSPSPDGTLLAVEGCYWACPYEVVIYDFSDPMNPPWFQFHRESNLENFMGWQSDTSCKIGRWYEVCKLEGKFKDRKEWDLTVEELEEIEEIQKEQELKESEVWEEVAHDVYEWKLPPFVDVARTYIVEQLEWFREKLDWFESDQGKGFFDDRLAMVRSFLDRLSTDDLAQLRSEPKTNEILSWWENYDREKGVSD